MLAELQKCMSPAQNMYESLNLAQRLHMPYRQNFWRMNTDLFVW